MIQGDVEVIVRGAATAAVTGLSAGVVWKLMRVFQNDVVLGLSKRLQEQAVELREAEGRMNEMETRTAARLTEMETRMSTALERANAVTVEMAQIQGKLEIALAHVRRCEEDLAALRGEAR